MLLSVKSLITHLVSFFYKKMTNLVEPLNSVLGCLFAAIKHHEQKCVSLNIIGPHNLIGTGTIRRYWSRYGLVGGSVTL